MRSSAVKGLIVVGGPSCIRHDLQSQLASPGIQVPYSYQTSVGVQRQMGDTMAVEANYVSTALRHEVVTRNINLNYDPATGANYRFTDFTKRPYPDCGNVPMTFTEGHSNYHGLETSFTQESSHEESTFRFSDGDGGAGSDRVAGADTSLWPSAHRGGSLDSAPNTRRPA